MALPVRTVTRPALLAGQVNGRLPADILVDTPGLGGGPVVRLVEPAAWAWRALCAAAAAAGFTLKATSAVDSYRPYAVQERTFLDRYSDTFIAGASTRRWMGQVWYLRPGYAPAAAPGTGNHGWGLAVDTAEERDDDPGAESLSAAALTWLVANEERFGFSHEIQSEPWHIRYYTGDRLPPAVLAFMEGAQDDVQLSDRVPLPLVEGNTQPNAAVGDVMGYQLVRGAATLRLVRELTTQIAALAQTVKELPELVATAVAAELQRRLDA